MSLLIIDDNDEVSLARDDSNSAAEQRDVTAKVIGWLAASEDHRPGCYVNDRAAARRDALEDMVQAAMSRNLRMEDAKQVRRIRIRSHHYSVASGRYVLAQFWGCRGDGTMLFETRKDEAFVERLASREIAV